MQHGISAANKTTIADTQSPSHSNVVTIAFAKNNTKVTNNHENELSCDQAERHVTYQLCFSANSRFRVRGERGVTLCR
jgi:hypothetical protein